MDVLVHGGAGDAPEEPAHRRECLESAAEAGSRAGTPLDAAEAAVRELESSPRFNAGVGSAVQSDGVVRTDAGVMTDDRTVGAACSMANVEHAVSVARVVAEETPHVLVAGEGAVALADAFGIETGVDCWSDRTRERWDDLDVPEGGTAEQLAWVRERFGRAERDGRGDDPAAVEDRDHDTVGAVAVDDGRLAAATSTGGRWLALAGRVGDVPQVGAGFYCCPDAAVSATGAGEDIARTTLARRVAIEIEAGRKPDAACSRALEAFSTIADSSAGVIAADVDGRLGSAFVSEAMQTARASR